MEDISEDEYITSFINKFGEEKRKADIKLRGILRKRGVSELEINKLIAQGDEQMIDAARKAYDENRGEFWKL